MYKNVHTGHEVWETKLRDVRLPALVRDDQSTRHPQQEHPDARDGRTEAELSHPAGGGGRVLLWTLNRSTQAQQCAFEHNTISRCACLSPEPVGAVTRKGRRHTPRYPTEAGTPDRGSRSTACDCDVRLHVYVQRTQWINMTTEAQSLEGSCEQSRHFSTFSLSKKVKLNVNTQPLFEFPNNTS